MKCEAVVVAGIYDAAEYCEFGGGRRGAAAAD
jgi:hypothetical protein